MKRKEKCKKLGEVINQCWNYYADDCFINDMGKRDTSMVFNRNEVAEISLDADRWRDFVKDDPKGKEAVEWYLGLSYSSRKSVLREAMPTKRYVY